MTAKQLLMVVPTEFGLQYGTYGALPIAADALEDGLYRYVESRPCREVWLNPEYRLIEVMTLIYHGAAVIGRRVSGPDGDQYPAGYGDVVDWPDYQTERPAAAVQRVAQRELHTALGVGIDVQVPPPSFVLTDDTHERGQNRLVLASLLPLERLVNPNQTALRSQRPDRERLFILNEAFAEDHRERLDGWARLGLRAVWTTVADKVSNQ